MVTASGKRLRRSNVPERTTSTILGAIETLLIWHSRKRERRDLAALGDLVLRDIGLTRADIESGYLKPFWRN